MNTWQLDKETCRWTTRRPQEVKPDTPDHRSTVRTGTCCASDLWKAREMQSTVIVQRGLG